MIEIEYEIKIDFGAEGVKTFKPGYPDEITKPYSELPAISYISGPNQHGKSNLLNMVALAFHGLEENANVNPSLINDIRKRIESKRIKGLTFSITIYDDKKNPIVRSVKMTTLIEILRHLSLLMVNGG